jgi:spermidine synthase
MKPTPRLVFGIVMFSLFVSGLTGLLYEIVWARYLGLLLGHTSYAVVAVLAAFMGGLALGNAWFGKQADRSVRPLAIYAWLEVGIGLYALIFPAYYTFSEDLYLTLARHGPPGSVTVLVLKFGLSLLMILLPTVLMGGTLPVLTRLVTRSLAELREKVAALYFINSLGAVAGCFVADYWLIPTVGLQATVWTGAGLSLVIGTVALLVSNWIEHRPESLSVPAVVHADTAEQFSPEELRIATVGIGISGFVAMLYEVAWTRLLALALGSSTHAFTLMLITFISGIACGAYLVYRWKRLRRTLSAFGWMEAALAVTMAVSMFLYGWLPYCFATLADMLARREGAYPVYELLQGLICFAVMFGPTVCLGMTLPLASRVATGELAHTGRAVGTVFAVNTAGTVLGAAVTGLWLMPALGLARTFTVGIVLNGAVGMLILGRRWPLQRISLLPGTALAAGLVWLAGWQFDSTWQRVFTLGLWRETNLPLNARQYDQAVKARRIAYYRDGAGSTVSVETGPGKTGEQLILRINGKVEASSEVDLPTQLLLGHIPMLLHPDAQQVLVIGLGSGMTCGAVTRHPNLKRLDVAEISPEVERAARLFAESNQGVLDDPRVRVFIEDAKTFLRTAAGQYDVIISEPSHPWVAGVAGVFSREHYENCRARLLPEGLMAQWIHLHGSSDAALDTVLATFASVFPHVSVWQPLPKDLVLVGSKQPMKLSWSGLAARIEAPLVKSDLERCHVTSLAVLLSREIISQANAPFVPTSGSVIQSDFYPSLEYMAQRDFFVRRNAERWRRFDETYSTRPSTWLGRYLRDHALTQADYSAFVRSYAVHSLISVDLLRSLLYRWRRESPDDLTPVELDSLLAEPPDPFELRAARLAPFRERIIEQAQQNPDMLRSYARLLMQTYRRQRSVYYLPPTTELRAALERLLQTDPTNQPVYRLYLAEVAWDLGDDRECLLQGRLAFNLNGPRVTSPDFSFDPLSPVAVLSRMLEALGRAGRFQEAWEICQQVRDEPFVRGPSGKIDPLFAMTLRKVQFAVDQEAAGSNR